MTHFSWQVQPFGRVHFHSTWQVQLETCGAAFFSDRHVRVPSSGDNLQIAWQVWDVVRMRFCLAGAVFGADPSRVECRFAQQEQYLGPSTLYTFHSTLSSTLRTLHFRLRTLHFTYLYTLYALHLH